MGIVLGYQESMTIEISLYLAIESDSHLALCTLQHTNRTNKIQSRTINLRLLTTFLRKTNLRYITFDFKFKQEL